MTEEDIIRLTYKTLKGEITLEEQRSLDQLCSEVPAFELIRDEIESTWRLGNRADLPFEVDVADDLGELWQIIDKEEDLGGGKVRKINPLEPVESQKARLIMPGMKVLLAAASLLLLAGFVWLMNQSAPDSTVVTTTDKTMEVALDDGSSVWVNRHSTLTYYIKEDERSIQLSGSAYFEVAPDPSAPFIVNVGPSQVRVLGTSFYINEDIEDREIGVGVVEGRVSFGTDDKGVVLASGQKGTYRYDDDALSRSDGHSINALAWKTGKFVFSDVPLRSVIDELTSYYEVNIVVDKEVMLACRISLVVDNSDLLYVLDKVASMMSMSVRERSDGSYSLTDGTCR